MTHNTNCFEYSGGEDAYNALADWRSWDAMLKVFNMILDSELVMEEGGSAMNGDDQDEEEGDVPDILTSGGNTNRLGYIVASVIVLVCAALC